jgi:two-component system, sensor histidine kinase and response regulator
MVSSVGLRHSEGGAEDYHLARSIVEAERPVVVGGPDGTLEVESFPFHAAEGMKVGLGIPLTLFGDTFGSLIVGYRSEYRVTPHDIRLAITLAGHAAVAISNARLHESVEQRSHDLEVAYGELNQATQAKERFFASINHELRNPLSAVIGYQTLVLEQPDGELPEMAQRYLRKAHLAANTLRVLVDDLLDLSKIAAGKMELNLRDCSLQEIIDGALNTIAPAAEAKRIPLVVIGVDRVGAIRTDPDRVQQILVNLLSNAVKFTAEGEVRVDVEVQEDQTFGREDDGTETVPPAIERATLLEIRVTDAGPGITAEDLTGIFEEFKQVSGTRGGTGLGLPISRRLARLLGGEVFATSEPGSGSTFTLRLVQQPSILLRAETPAG